MCVCVCGPQLDEFKLDLGQLDLGEITKIEIGFATQQTVAGKVGGLFGQQWFLQSVEVRYLSYTAPHHAAPYHVKNACYSKCF